MPSKKTSASTPRGRGRTSAARAHQGRAAAARAAGSRIRETWHATVEAFTSAEAEAERQLRLLLARNNINAAEARAAVATFRARVLKERKKAVRQIDSRLSGVQERLRRESRHLGRVVDEAVRGTLVALNIPSRREVAELTRKVDELTRKIDGFRRKSKDAAPRRRARTATRAAANAQ